MKKIRNPFQKQGVSKYPLIGNMIGQDTVFMRLNWLKESHLSSLECSFLTIFGDWGMGKTRLGHELVAEKVGTSKSWVIVDKDEEYKDKKILDPEVPIFPLFINFEDIFEFRPINKDNIFLKIIYAAFNNLINKEDSKIQEDLKKKLEEIDPTLIDVIEDLLRSKKNDLKNFVNLIRSKVLVNSNDKILKFWIIVDEVEERGETLGTPAEELRERKEYERGDLDDFANAIKREVNRGQTEDEINILDNFDFILLCSEGVESFFMGIGALERRYKDVHIKKPSIKDFEEFIIYLKNTGIEDLDFPGESLNSAIISVDCNFGWFNYFMYSIYQKNRITPGLEDVELLEDAGRSLGKLFNYNMINNIEDDDKRPEIENLQQIIIKQIPVSEQELSIAEDKITELINYTDPNNIPVFKSLIPVNIRKTEFQRILTTEKGFEYRKVKGREESTILSRGGDTFDNEYLFNQLRIFEISPNTFLIYSDLDEFKVYLQFLTYSNFSEKTIEDFNEIFKDHQEISLGNYIGISMEFLTKFNLRWSDISFKKKWLASDKLDLVLKKINSGPLTRLEIQKRICTGIGKTRLFLKYGKQNYEYTPSASQDIKSPHIVLNLKEAEKGENLCLLPSKKLLILYYTDKEMMLGDFNEILKKPMITYLIIGDSDSENDYLEIIKRAPKVEKYIITKMILYNQKEHNFFLQFSFADEIFNFKDILTEEYIENIWELSEIEVEKWKQYIEQAGYLIQPIIKFTGQILTADIFNDIFSLIIEGYNYSDFNDPNTIRNDEKRKQYKKFFDNFKSFLKDTKGSQMIFNFIDPEDIDTAELNSNLTIPKFLIKILELIKEGVTISNMSKEFFYESKMYKQSLKSIQNALKPLLELLKVYGIVKEISGNEYNIIDSDLLKTEYKLAQNKIAHWLDESKEDSMQELEEFYQERLPSYFKVDSHELERYQKDLDDYENEINDIEFNRLFKEDISTADFLDTSQKVKGALNQASKIIKAELSLSTDNISDVGGDTTLMVYSAQERIDFLIKTKDYIEGTIKNIKTNIINIKQDINLTYSSCGGKSFITEPIEMVLDTIMNDIGWDEEALFPDILESFNMNMEHIDKTPLVSLMKSSLINNIIDKLDFYLASLSTGNNSIWQKFISLHENWENILNNKLEFERTWKKAEDYYMGSPESKGTRVWHEGKITEKERITEYLEEFKQTAEAQVGDDLNEMESVIDEIDSTMEELKELAQNKYDEGIKEIIDDINKTDLEYLGKLEIGIESHQSTTSDHILEIPKHNDQHQAIEELKNKIEIRAIELLDNNKLWKKYKEIIKIKEDNSMTDNEIIDHIGLEIISQLNEKGALEHVTKTIHEINI